MLRTDARVEPTAFLELETRVLELATRARSRRHLRPAGPFRSRTDMRVQRGIPSRWPKTRPIRLCEVDRPRRVAGHAQSLRGPSVAQTLHRPLGANSEHRPLFAGAQSCLLLRSRQGWRALDRRTNSSSAFQRRAGPFCGLRNAWRPAAGPQRRGHTHSNTNCLSFSANTLDETTSATTGVVPKGLNDFQNREGGFLQC